MATKRAWGAQDSRRVSLQPQIWNVQWLGCTHLILLCDRRLLVGSLMMCAGNAEVERAQQAARQAELLASEAKKGEIEEKHKTSELPACFVTGRHTYGFWMLLGCLSQSSSLSARWDFHQSSRLMCGPGTRPWLDQSRKSDVPEPPQLCSAIPAIRL